MKSNIFVLLVILILAGLLMPPAATATLSPPPTALIAISPPDADIVPEGLPVLTRLQSSRGSLLLALADPLRRRQMSAAGASIQMLDRDARNAVYILTAALGPGAGEGALPNWEEYGRVLWQEGTQALLRTTSAQATRLAAEKVEIRQLHPRPFHSHPRTTEGIPGDVDADPAIQALIDQVEISDVVAYDGQLSGAWPAIIGGESYTIATRHTYSGPPIRKATQFVGEQLEAAGLDVTYQNWNSSDYPNVIGELPGQTNPAQILIICAHVDDMPSGILAPGADDNASGTTGVLVAADILGQHQWDVTLRFALWTGEEQGLLGSAAYAAQAAAAGEDIIGVLNMDMIGYDSDAYPILDLHARSDLGNSENIAYLLADVVDEYDLALQPQVLIDNWLGNYSDNASFWDESYPAILVIEDYDDFTPYYHTVDDRLATLDTDYFAAAVEAAVGTAAHIAGYIPPPTATGILSGAVSAAASGDPISGAIVTAQAPAQTPLTTTTTATGVYTAVLPVAAYTLTVAASGYLTATVSEAPVVTDTVTTRHVTLSPDAGTLAGQVVDAETAIPLPAAQITIFTAGPSPTPVLTSPVDGNGRYTVTLPSGAYDMLVTAPGYISLQPPTITITAGTAFTLNVTLTPAPVTFTLYIPLLAGPSQQILQNPLK